jgi:O-antigen ligase
MELFVLKLVALIRPLASIDIFEELYAAFAVGLFAVLTGALLLHVAIRQSLRLSIVDGMIAAFSVWCIAVSLIYYRQTVWGEVAKLLIPLISYTVVKNVVREREQYRRLLFWMIAGFGVPILLSAAEILTESADALYKVNYWTGIARWKGVYANAHTFGHSMTLFLMITAIYIKLDLRVRAQSGAPQMFRNTVLGLLAIVALYCLYMSEVRTSVVGLLVFVATYAYFYNKKMLVVGALGLVMVGALTLPYWFATLLPELDMKERGMNISVMDLGSGRPRIWQNEFRVFLERPIDEQLAGDGIGNRRLEFADQTIRGHNDWLELLTQTGLVGFLLFGALQVQILRAILRMRSEERYAYLGLFAAVSVMMFFSNSYAWRIQVSHLYYMVLAFIEMPAIQEQREHAVAKGAINTA